MSRHNRTFPLRKSERLWLRVLCVPVVCDGSIAALPSLSPNSLKRVLSAAEIHSVLPAVLRNAKIRVFDLRPHACPMTDSSPIRECLVDYEALDVMLRARNLKLRFWSKQISNAFEEHSIEFCIVKGPDFASKLYPHEADRSYSDIDILVSKTTIAQANSVAAKLGLCSTQEVERPGEKFLEYKWGHPNESDLNVELHGDLIHSPKLRCAQSYTYERHSNIRNGLLGDALGYPVLAAVHGAYSHQFDRLQHLIDLRLAVRRLMACEPVSVDLQEAFSDPNLKALSGVVHAGVRMAGEMFSCAECERFLMMSGIEALGMDWMKSNHVLQAQSIAGGLNSWRRKLFRSQLKKLEHPAFS